MDQIKISSLNAELQKVAKVQMNLRIVLNKREEQVKLKEKEIETRDKNISELEYKLQKTQGEYFDQGNNIDTKMQKNYTLAEWHELEKEIRIENANIKK